jgi:hypothetical protein
MDSTTTSGTRTPVRPASSTSRGAAGLTPSTATGAVHIRHTSSRQGPSRVVPPVQCRIAHPGTFLRIRPRPEAGFPTFAA